LALGPKDASGVFSGGLGEDVYVAACLSEKDEKLVKKLIADVPEQPSLLDEDNLQTIEATALKHFADFVTGVSSSADCTTQEITAAHVYAKFANSAVSKAIAAQYLAERLLRKHDAGELPSEMLRARLPKYLVEAIGYVTSTAPSESLPNNVNE
jgi:hypothetical protein